MQVVPGLRARMAGNLLRLFPDVIFLGHGGHVPFSRWGPRGSVRLTGSSSRNRGVGNSVLLLA